ncbi:hypothetical protein LNV23_19060 [Paucibacter sp. DJ1R-11]|uniref:hypothetical protein n=1 Tax=Paucibacter sp. DJ1R-11 TaxID=2893556 RepID=UPI0021E4845F|nr:hypothetical protein [Paucibacter sp. DJ1R-11]MCV2365554.1 hypothetical protein [Paucibacter sp. DJ1R-11]
MSLHPIALALNVSRRPEVRSRPQLQSGVLVTEYVLQVWAERGGTDYRIERSMGFGPSAAVAAGHKAALLKPGTVIKVQADRERIVGGKQARIELMGCTQLDPVHLQARHYHEAPEKEAA